MFGRRKREAKPKHVSVMFPSFFLFLTRIRQFFKHRISCLSFEERKGNHSLIKSPDHVSGCRFHSLFFCLILHVRFLSHSFFSIRCFGILSRAHCVRISEQVWKSRRCYHWKSDCILWIPDLVLGTITSMAHPNLRCNWRSVVSHRRVSQGKERGTWNSQKGAASTSSS